MSSKTTTTKKIIFISGLLGLSLANAMFDPSLSLNPQDYLVPNQFVVMQKPGAKGIAPMSDTTLMSAITSLSEVLGIPVEDTPQPLALPGAVVLTLSAVQAGVQVAAQTVADAFPEGSIVLPVYRVYPTALKKRPKDLDPTKEELYPKQWHYKQINLPKAWKTTKGKDSIVVAVIDTGVLPHPDLKDNLLPGYDFYDGGDGYDPDPTDSGDGVPPKKLSSWHGTHVAGIIAAVLNKVGVVGVAPLVKILPIRASGPLGGTTTDIINGIFYAIGEEVPLADGEKISSKHKADIINLSLGGPIPCQADFQLAIEKALKAGVTVVIAAGNARVDAKNFFPANCLGGITIAATNMKEELASYSNFGKTISLSAPGGEVFHVGHDKSNAVLSTRNSGKFKVGEHSYDGMAGTSMATSLVSGVVALMLSVAPDKTLSPIQIKDILVKTARPFPETQSRQACTQEKCGAGILDAGAAVKAAMKEEEVAPSIFEDFLKDLFRDLYL